MSSYLDSLIFGIRDVFDKLGAKLPPRTALQFKGAVTVEDDPESRRTIVTVTGGGGGVTELDGDVTGPSTATVVAKVGGADVAFDHEDSGRVELEGGELVVKPRYLAEVEIDVTDPPSEPIYVVPECLAARITEVLVVVTEKLDGSGEVEVKAGTSAGASDLLDARTIDETTEGIVAGDDYNDLGAKFTAARFYVWRAAKDDEVHVSITPTGTVNSGRIRVRIKGEVIT